jgi:energy-coupling factor transporter ATP-binding protein EcfA2
MKILAITGQAGSGKSTLANLLYSCGWKHTRFSTPLKLMFAELLKYQGLDQSIIRRMIDGDLKETPTSFLGNKTPRYAMQTLGTEWRDLIDRNLWSDAWKRNILNLPDNSKIVIDDLRFKHEARTVMVLGGKIIRIERPNNKILIDNSQNHISETEMNEIISDKIILNDSTPEKMLDQLRTFMEY